MIAAPAPDPAPDPDPDAPARGGNGDDPIRIYEDGTVRLSNGIFTRGSETKAGYRVVVIIGKRWGVHQLVKIAHDRRLGIDEFADPTKVSFDHKNQDRSDNRYANIGAATFQEQTNNQTRTRSHASKQSKPIRGRRVDDTRETAWVTYASTSEAARALDLNQGNISAVADPEKKGIHTTGGFVFEFVPIADLPGEIWTKIKRYDRKTDKLETMEKEMVSNMGRYKNGDGAISEPEPDDTGVCQVRVQGTRRTIPSLILDSFDVPLPEGLARKDVVASYILPYLSKANAIENLVWKTQTQVKKDANTNPDRKSNGLARSIGIRGRQVGTENWVEYASMSEPKESVGVSQGDISRCLSNKNSQTTARGKDGLTYEFERLPDPLEPAGDVSWVELLHRDLSKIAEILARAETKVAANAKAKVQKKRPAGAGGGGGQPKLARFWKK